MTPLRQFAPWSAEAPLPYTITRKVLPDGREGIGYTDEISHADRRNGNLWVQRPALRGRGKPDLAAIHPLRQRQAMSHMLCMVCGNTTFNDDFRRWGHRRLFIARAVENHPIRDGEVTDTPPVCLPCAIESAGACPHLRRGHAAVLVKRAEPWGVAGDLYDPRTLRRIPAPAGKELSKVADEDPAICWTLAARDLVVLNGCTPVDLNDLAALSAAA